jgi:ATP-binding cassette subfamily C protein LapB
MLCHTDGSGWGVVVDRSPSGEWVVETSEGSQQVTAAALAHKVAMLPLGPAAEMGWGLGIVQRKKETASFFSHVREALALYRPELLEACLASAFIGLLALATSLFSMQVYDRVIPTRSEYTLLILSLGVLLSILIELAMKYARSHIMDHVVMGLDSRLSREIFNRLLQLRVDQIPASVGSLGKLAISCWTARCSCRANPAITS